MPATVARNKQDVENMDRRQRLWDSLDYSYGVKADRSDEEFRKAYSQADRQMLSRGMQRSSYGAQTLANLDQQRIRTRNDIESEKIADYENRLQDIENQEQKQARWQAQFDEGVRQYNTNLAFQQAQADTKKEQWQKNFDADRGDTAWNQAFQEKQFEAGRSDTAWNQAFQREQADTQKNQWNATFNYQKERDAVGDQQWQKAFDQNNTDTDRKLAASYVSAIIANGQDPTDDLLARAGLSRADANAMKAQVAESGGGWYGGESSGGGGRRSTGRQNPPPKDTGNGNGTGSDFSEFMKNFTSGESNFVSGASNFFGGSSTSTPKSTTAPAVNTLNLNDSKNKNKNENKRRSSSMA